MIQLVEQQLEHTFDGEWTASKYDEWSFYCNHFQGSCTGNKAVDFIAVDPAGKTLWLIELKDYRVHRRTKPIALPDEIAIKARDTLAGLVAAAMHHADHAHAADARKSLGATRIRIVLHIEQPRTTSKLFPRAYKLPDLQQKLKQLVRVIDPHPVVTAIDEPSPLPWSFRSISREATMTRQP